MSSTESSQESPEEALQEAMETSEGVRRLGMMAGVKSLNRNLRNEDNAVDRSIRWHEDELSEGMSSTEEEPEAVDIMAARDVHVYQDPKQQGAGGGQQPQPSQQTKPKPSSDLAKKMAAAGLAAAGVGGGLAAPIAAYNLTRPAVEKALEQEDATVRVGLGKIEDYLDEPTERND